MTLQDSTALRNARNDQVTTAAGNAAIIEIRTGVAAGVGNAAGGSLLASFVCGTPFATASAAGVLTLTAIASVTATGSGSAGHFRLKTSGGTAVREGSVSATGGGGDITINTTTIASGGLVSVTSGTFTAGNA